MNEETLTEEEKYETEKNHYVTYALLALGIIIVSFIYWQFSQPSSDAVMVDTELVNTNTVVGNQSANTVADLPPTVAVEEGTKPVAEGEDFGLAEVSTTFISPRSVADAVVFYTAEIKVKGGTISSTMRTPEKEIIVATTADGKPYVVYIGEKDGETVVTINVDPAQ